MERLEYPKKSPFGRPIPGTGAPRMPDNALTLDIASPDVPYIVDRVPEEDVELLRFLVDASIVPDHQVRVVEAAPYLGVLTVGTQDKTIALGYNVARQIVVRPA
jgi:Fe2+ transport system protein FeoA